MERVKLGRNGKVDKRIYNGGHSPAGAGRQLGTVNKFPTALRAKAAEDHKAAGGIMPMDFMLEVLRNNKVSGGTGKGKWDYPVSWEDKKWAADKLLHCFTPKLTSTTLKGTVQVLALPPEALKDMSTEELIVMEKVLSRVAGESNGSNPTTLNGYKNGNGYDLVGPEAYAEELVEE